MYVYELLKVHKGMVDFCGVLNLPASARLSLTRNFVCGVDLGIYILQDWVGPQEDILGIIFIWFGNYRTVHDDFLY